MNLQDTLFSIEKFLDIPIDSLAPLADLDDIGGYHPDESQRKWGTGAIWEVEGKVLYAVIRSLKPTLVIEIGSGSGCSANHIAAALKANGRGRLVTIDRGNTPFILPEYAELVEVLPGDGVAYLEGLQNNSVDFILEDGDHSSAQTYAVAELAKHKLKPGGVLMAHDAAHFAVGNDIIEGYSRAGVDFRVYLTEPSDCGWLVFRKPADREIEMGNTAYSKLGNGPWEKIDLTTGDRLVIDEPVLQADGDEPEEVPPPAPKKRTRKKANP